MAANQIIKIIKLVARMCPVCPLNIKRAARTCPLIIKVRKNHLQLVMISFTNNLKLWAYDSPFILAYSSPI